MTHYDPLDPTLRVVKVFELSNNKEILIKKVGSDHRSNGYRVILLNIREEKEKILLDTLFSKESKAIEGVSRWLKSQKKVQF